MAVGKVKGKKTVRSGQKPTNKKRSKGTDRKRTEQGSTVREKKAEKIVPSFFEATRRKRASNDIVEPQRTSSSSLLPHSSERDRHSSSSSSERDRGRQHSSSSSSYGSLAGGGEHVQSKRRGRKAREPQSEGEGGRDGDERRRRRGEKERGDVGVSSESGGEGEGGEHTKERRRKRFREVRISNTAVAKWTPVSMATRDLLSSAMLSALGQCLEGLSGSTRRNADTAIQRVMQQVQRKVATAKAPPAKRMKSSSDLKQRVAELKERCLDLVSKNEGTVQRLEERKMFCEEKREMAGQLETGTETRVQSNHHIIAVSPLADSEDGSFEAYIQDLLSPTPHSSLTPSLLAQDITPSH